MKALLSIIRTRRGAWNDCMPPSPAERMARYSARLAAEMQDRENASAALPRARVVDGRAVLVAFPARLNPLPKDHT